MQVEGKAQFAKAAMLCPWLRYPITNLGGTVRLANNALKVHRACAPEEHSILLLCSAAKKLGCKHAVGEVSVLPPSCLEVDLYST